MAAFNLNTRSTSNLRGSKEIESIGDDLVNISSSISQISGSLGVNATSSFGRIESDSNLVISSSKTRIEGIEILLNDANTGIAFTDDNINITVGNVNMLDFTEGATDEVTFNESGADLDFRIESDDDDKAFYINAGLNRIELGSSTNTSVTASGNVRIVGQLGVGSDLNGNEGKNTVQINHSGADGDNGIMIVRDDTTVVANNLLGGIGFDSQDGNVPSSILEASAFIAGYAGETQGTVDKGGYIGIGSTDIDDNDDTAGDTYMYFGKGGLEFQLNSRIDHSAYSYMSKFNSTDSTENNVKVIAVQRNGSDRLLIYSDGDVYNTNNTYGSLSDIRFKTNIVDLKDNSLDKILQLRPVSFNWNEKSENDVNKPMVGYIAQEVEKVLPNVVDTHDHSGNGGLKDEKSINHPHLIPYLVKSIQQLSAKIDKLEKQLKNK